MMTFTFTDKINLTSQNTLKASVNKISILESLIKTPQLLMYLG